MDDAARQSEARPPRGRLQGLLRDVGALDEAVFAAIVETPTPSLDRPLRSLSRAADNSKLWLAAAAGVAAVGGRRGRRAALAGLASLATSSAIVNIAIKQGAQRRRPVRAQALTGRHVPVPRSSSFPSGHSASAFAFAVGAGTELPVLALPLNVAASLVAYSRVHAGVHYPSDVVAGATIGAATGSGVSRILNRSSRRGAAPSQNAAV